MNKLSLFSGIGGDDLASEWAGITTVCMVEKDKYCQRVLKKHWPDVPIIEDVKDVTKEKIITYGERLGRETRTRESLRPEEQTTIRQNIGNIRAESRIDLISGGFPCQPHSVAGKRKGSADERNLWPEFRRIIGEIKPRWVVGENVPGIFTSDSRRFFGTILSDLAEMGYSVGWCTFGAVDVGALHRRNRVFILAYSANDRRTWTRVSISEWRQNEENTYSSRSSEDVADSDQQGLQGRGGRELPECSSEWIARTSNPLSYPQSTERGRTDEQEHTRGRDKEIGGQGISIRGTKYWQSEPNVGRVANGVPSRVHRLRGLGNAVVPQQAYEIYRAIMGCEVEINHAEQKH
jgi:DNA (cytosine-5)-methyltransferase 1